MKLRPENFEPPYPAFTCALFELKPNVTLGQIAVQYPDNGSGSSGAALREAIEATLTGDAAPWRNEWCSHVDPQGYRNDICVAYWHHQDDFRQWRARQDVGLWAAETHDIGLWIEVLTCPIPTMETSYSNEHPDWGLASRCPVRLDPDHGYFGSMRDRIPKAEDNGLPGELRELPATDLEQETIGHRVTVSLPDNVCFIRTVQGWQDCDTEQQADFLENMMPVYHTGVEYLRENPRDTNCVSARLVEMDNDGTQVQTQTLAWFLGLEDLERWAHEHPTHHAILDGMSSFAERYNLQIQIVLGHEVFVVPAGYSHIEYSNCHPHTGFLRFLRAEPLT